ncbi:MAG: hypothetical protein IJU84_05275 [Clostridia bacterium]|nr:hypothetical protein [Clostridia bacterium]
MIFLLAVTIAASCAGCDFSSAEPSGQGVSSSESSETGETSSVADPQAETSSPDDVSSAAEQPAIIRNANYADYENRGYNALFADKYLENGIRLVGASGEKTGELLFENSKDQPSWSFAQWFTKYDISEYYDRSYTDGGAEFTYASKGKFIGGKYVPAKILSVNSNTGKIYMRLNAQVEYDRPRTSGEGWPHTLLSQGFDDRLIKVSEQSEIFMTMEYKVTGFEDIMGASADPNLHCGQMVWYVTLQNRVRSNPDYGTYVWFGLQLWDNRHEGVKVKEFAQQDAGKEDSTNQFIFNPAGDYYFENGMQPAVGERRKVDFNILPVAEIALNKAKSRGFLQNTEWEDIYIGGMNFGFEVTGTYNIGAEIYSVGVYYK